MTKSSDKRCPKCGRREITLADVRKGDVEGKCPTAFAIRDPEAEEDCRRAWTDEQIVRNFFDSIECTCETDASSLKWSKIPMENCTCPFRQVKEALEAFERVVSTSIHKHI